jgi:Zn-dependent protease with chaperone function
MKYTPRRFNADLNRNRENELLAFAKHVLAVCVLIAGLYWICNGLLVALVDHLPPKTEARLWQALSRHTDTDDTASTAATARYPEVVALFARLPKPDVPDYLPLHLVIVPEDDPNALAHLDGTVYLHEGLLKTINSENALAFVLAHELGHYALRHHIKQFGRVAVIGLLNIAFGIGGSALDEGAAGISAARVASTFSQRDESAADRYALQVLVAHYGHAGGATAFFENLQASTPRWMARWEKWLDSTHPLTADRIKALRRIIAEKHIPVRETIPLGKTPA